MNKPKVLFPFTEAGLGHIIPMRSIADEFERLYGDKTEVVRSNFFTEAGNKNLEIFENRMKRNVEIQNRHTSFGFWSTLNMEFWRIHVGTWATMKFLKLGACKPGYKYMDELAPDLVVSTHWATNYYAIKCKRKPLTVMYCPDAEINPLFSYKADIVMVSTSTGYKNAIRKHRIRFNDKNLMQVPFLIRDAAYKVSTDKRELRQKLGLDEDKFTVVLAEGGYGIGKMEEICKIILERDLPVNLVPVCGKNEELYKKLQNVKSKGNTTFKPMGLVDNMLEVVASADVFCGKSGANTCAEACFFGLPMIITKYATTIERYIGRYYIDVVGNALKIFKPEKVVDKIEEFIKNPSLVEPYKKAAEAQRSNYGATECARHIFDLLCTKYPELKN